METKTSYYRDPDYVQGQIVALQSLILALAQSVPKEFFREQGLARLEALRTTTLSMPVPDSRLAAVDHAEEWLRTVTS